MIAAPRLDLAELVARFAAGRDYATVAAFRSDHPDHGFAAAATITAELRALGFTSGFAFTARPRVDLLGYENWLHLAVRKWCEGRRCVTLDQFAAAHPDLPACTASRREIAGALERLGYRRALVRSPA